MLTEKQLKQIKDELDNCQKPLFLFDDDPDGLSSFLVLYRYKKEGKRNIFKKKNKKKKKKIIKKKKKKKKKKYYFFFFFFYQKKKKK